MERNSPAGQIIANLIQFRKFWLVPLFLCTLAALFYALFASKTYTTRQSLVVRDDLVGTFYKPGRFDSLDLMKSAQETILEISRRPQVVREALKKLGPPSLTTEASWLSDLNLEKTQGMIQISAPNGAEFGRTEAIVLSVSQDSRERSSKFISLLLDEIEKSLRNLRSQQFDSMEQELNQAAIVAEKAYKTAAEKLKVIEKNVGADLSTLISLNDSQAGTNNIQSELTGLRVEQRKAWADLKEVQKQHEILSNVSASPDELLEVPQELLALQPTLASLAKGLNDAVLKRSKTKGRYQSSHPLVRETEREVEDIRERFKNKLERTIGSLNYQLELRQGKHEQISSLIAQKQQRLSELSSMRVDYETVKATATKKREIYGKSQASLAEIESLGAAAKNIDLISRVGQPQTELYADGPSKKVVVGAGMAAGLFIGLGLVMFVAPFDDSNGPPRNDSTPPQSDRDSANTGAEKENQTAATPVQTSEPPETPVEPPEPTRRLEPVKSLAKRLESIKQPEKAEPDETSTKPVKTITKPVKTITKPVEFAKPIETTTELPVEVSKPVEVSRPEEPAKALEPVPKPEPVPTQEIIQNPDLPTNEEAGTSIPFSDSDTSFAASLLDDVASVTSDIKSEIKPVAETDTIFDQSKTETNADLLDSFFSAQRNNASEAPTSDSIEDDNDEFSVSKLSSGFPLASGGPDSEEHESPEKEISDEEIDRIIAQESSLSESDLQRLRVGQTSPSDASENLDQQEQSENQTDNQLNWSTESMTVTGDSSLSPETTGLPLDTSIQNSAETENIGHDSVTNSGDNQPENRPTATTVDLRMLKEQLSGKNKDQKPKPTLSEKLAQAESEDKSQAVKRELDQTIADLANSIADVCKKSNND